LQESKQAEQQRREEAQRQAERAERQREKDHVATQVDAKKKAQRAAHEKKMEVERAKQARPPPPAPRPQPAGDSVLGSSQDKPLPAAPVHRAEAGPARPPSRLNSRPQEDFSRSVNQSLQNTTKAPPKRPLPQENAEDSQTRPALQRNPQSYQQAESKRRRTDDNQDEDMADSPPRGAMAPPVRQSGIKKVRYFFLGWYVYVANDI
jgi:hypothetical protein